MRDDLRFYLPDSEKLDPEQKKINVLPYYISFVVEGGPGTGKTTLAMARAESLSKQGYRTLLLVHSRLLLRCIQESQPKTNWETVEFYTINSDGTYDYRDFNSYYSAFTFSRWLDDLYMQRFGEHYPVIAKDKPDWDLIEERVRSLGKIYDAIVVDEGQDFPVPLLRCLRSLSASVSVFLDPLQATGETRTTANVAAYVLSADIYSLSVNYRSTKAINDVSNLFRRNSAVCSVPGRDGSAPAVIASSGYDEELTRITEILAATKGKTVGIILDTRPAQQLYDDLRSRRGAEISVQLYNPKDYRSFDCGTGRVKIVSYSNAKGLEFDIVLLPQFTRAASTSDEASDLARINIAVSRAREQLYLFTRQGERDSASRWIDTSSILRAHPESFLFLY